MEISNNMYAEQLPFNQDMIGKIIPHRRPFLFLASIERLIPGQLAVGTLIDRNDPQYDYLRAHFLGYPIFAGGLMIEALAEVAGVALGSHPDFQGKLGTLAGVREFKFHSFVRPGEVVRLEAEIITKRLSYGRSRVKALVEERVRAEGVIAFGIVDMPEGLIIAI